MQFLGQCGRTIGWRYPVLDLVPPMGNPGSATGYLFGFDIPFNAVSFVVVYL